MRETWDKTMEERTKTCARAEDLIAYLYQEATLAEARAFESHMEHCAACRAELASFGNVREAIGEWRELSLGKVTSPAFEASVAFAPTQAVRQRRSALAALREFFTLSPLWMRAATAFAAVVFCALAAIAVVHFTAQPKVVVLEQPVQTDNVKKDDAPQVATGVQPNAPAVKEQTDSSKESVAINNNPPAPKQIKRRAVATPQLVAKQKRMSPRTVNQMPEEEVASADDYLPFTASRREAKLPSLVDLVDDSN
jgi:hypothetical protein